MDIVRNIQQFNAGRDPERLALKYQKMRADPFVFLRGSCHLFYDRLPDERLFVRAPAVWICGDLHLENFGSYKGDNRLVYFDVNDFDEAALAPATWELVRLLCSILVAAPGLKLTEPEGEALARTFLAAYATALSDGKARWLERETSDGLIHQLLDTIRNRQRGAFLDSRAPLAGKKRRLTVDGRKALPASAGQRSRVDQFMRDFAQGRDNPKFFKVLDVARRIAGTGSLGGERYIVLVEGKGSPDGNYLLDLKAAAPSALLPHLPVRQPKWKTEAQRIVGVQRRVQAISMAFLEAVKIGKTPFVLRGLQPSEDRVNLAESSRHLRHLEALMGDLGRIVAWGQLRSSGRDGSAIADELIDFGARSKWQHQLLEVARHCAAQTVLDWQTYARAYDDGVFR